MCTRPVEEELDLHLAWHWPAERPSRRHLLSTQMLLAGSNTVMDTQEPPCVNTRAIRTVVYREESAAALYPGPTLQQPPHPKVLILHGL